MWSVRTSRLNRKALPVRSAVHQLEQQPATKVAKHYDIRVADDTALCPSVVRTAAVSANRITTAETYIHRSEVFSSTNDHVPQKTTDHVPQQNFQNWCCCRPFLCPALTSILRCSTHTPTYFVHAPWKLTVELLSNPHTVRCRLCRLCGICIFSGKLALLGATCFSYGHTIHKNQARTSEDLQARGSRNHRVPGSLLWSKKACERKTYHENQGESLSIVLLSFVLRAS